MDPSTDASTICTPRSDSAAATPRTRSDSPRCDSPAAPIVERIIPQCGVVLENCSPGLLASQESLEKVRANLQRHGMVLLRGSEMESWSGDGMRDFMANFVPKSNMLSFDSSKLPTADRTVTVVKGEATGEQIEKVSGNIRILGNLGGTKAALADVDFEWHSDGEVSGGANRDVAFLSLLHCKQTPSGGGETLFVDGEKAFRRLALEEKFEGQAEGEILLDLADRLVAVTSNRFTAGGPCSIDVKHGLKMNRLGTKLSQPSASRREGWALNEKRVKLVQNVAVAGQKVAGQKGEEIVKKCICVGAKNLDFFEEMSSTGADTAVVKRVYSVEESRDLLDRILRAGMGVAADYEENTDPSATPLHHSAAFDCENSVLAHVWQRGDAVLWDNRRVLHSTTSTCHYKPDRSAPREMWQVMGLGSLAGVSDGAAENTEEGEAFKNYYLLS